MLKPDQITAIIDTREQRPLDLILPGGERLATIRATLPTGDYSVVGLDNPAGVCVERKSLPDLIACIAQERERFEDELNRMLAYRSRCVVVEATWMDIEAHNYRSRVNPQSAIGSILKWISMGIPFVLAGTPQRASEYVARLLFGAARLRHGEMTAMLEGTQKPRRGKKTDLKEAI